MTNGVSLKQVFEFSKSGERIKTYSTIYTYIYISVSGKITFFCEKSSFFEAGDPFFWANDHGFGFYGKFPIQ